jgi:glucose-6-phosphate isomerase
MTSAKLYDHDVAGCFAGKIGVAGLDEAQHAALLGESAGGLARLREWHADNTLPLLRLPAARADLKALKPIAERYRKTCDTVVVLGTGGSSLGGKTLNSLVDRGFGPPKGAPKQYFMDNVDPDTFESFFAKTDLRRTGFVVISKSGSTAETMTQFLICLDAFGKTLAKAKDRITVITEPKDNVLRRIAEAHGFATLDHDPKVGGRFSVLSLVGLLPAMIAGLDAVAIRRGAASVLDPVLKEAAPETIAPAVGAAIAVGLAQTRSVNQSVFMPYIDRLADFGLWYRQLWAESLGKDGKGTTPIRAVGTVDQHSQLQLYLDGPKDKKFTVALLDCARAGKRVPAALAADPSLGYLSGRTMGALMDAEGRATAETLLGRGRPTRIFRLKKLDAAAMGALMMHYMLETIVAAHLLGVDAFDQPAVEEGKMLTRQYLSESRKGRAVAPRATGRRAKAA